MVAIDVEAKIRYERLKDRAENSGDQEKTWEQFQKEHEAETEIYIPELMKQADVTVNNDGTLEELYKQLDKLIT